MGLEWLRVRAQYAHVVTQALARGVTQDELATRAGVSQAQISRAKNGKGSDDGPPLMTVIRIVEATGASLTEFFAALEGPRTSTGMTIVEPDPSELAAEIIAAREDRALAKAVRNALRVAQRQAAPRKPRLNG